VTIGSRIAHLEEQQRERDKPMILIIFNVLGQETSCFGPPPTPEQRAELDAELARRRVHCPAAIWHGSVEATLEAICQPYGTNRPRRELGR
jgi:hypothetical protein